MFRLLVSFNTRASIWDIFINDHRLLTLDMNRELVSLQALFVNINDSAYPGNLYVPITGWITYFVDEPCHFPEKIFK